MRARLCVDVSVEGEKDRVRGVEVGEVLETGKRDGDPSSRATGEARHSNARSDLRAVAAAAVAEEGDDAGSPAETAELFWVWHDGMTVTLDPHSHKRSVSRAAAAAAAGAEKGRAGQEMEHRRRAL